MRLEVWLEDEQVVDYAFPADKKDEFRTRGRIGLQVHGASKDAATQRVRFRRLRLREWPVVLLRDQFSPRIQVEAGSLP